MAVAQTSLAAFAAIREKLPSARGKVFGVIYGFSGPICDHQIAMILKWPHHCVTPRRGELADMGYIRVAFVKDGPPNWKEVAYWEVHPDCLCPGWKPKALKRQSRDTKRPISIREAAMALVAHRRRLRALRHKREVLPLFGGGATQ